MKRNKRRKVKIQVPTPENDFSETKKNKLKYIVPTYLILKQLAYHENEYNIRENRTLYNYIISLFVIKI